jgi:hypothetical protein
LSSLFIKPTDVGKRVTVQYFDDDGSRHEVVGLLERAEVHEGKALLHIRRRDDSLVSVPLSRIRAGRVVPPSSR